MGVPAGTLGTPGGSASTALPENDGKAELTSQIFNAYAPGFRGGVHVATGNFDGNLTTVVGGTTMFPDQLVTAAGEGGGPHVIVWRMKENADGTVVNDGIITQLFPFDSRFRGGVNVTAGDLDGDGKAELICAAGPGGGPHVKVYRFVSTPTTDANGTRRIEGHFDLVNEFFAYDAGFRGGVSLASGTGYRETTVLRQVLNSDLPIDFAPVDYSFNQPVPQGPITAVDPTLDPGINLSSIGESLAGQTLNAAGDATVGYFTVGAGDISYLGANLTGNLGNIGYRPNLGITNPLVYVKWSDAKKVPAGFDLDTSYGPFVLIRAAVADQPAVVRRLQEGPGASSFRNQLVTGAGPGGGAHVRVWDFNTNAAGRVVNNGVVKEFIAFSATNANFRGGVNVAINDFVDFPTPGNPVNPDLAVSYAGANFPLVNQIGQPQFRRLYGAYSAEILVSMASQGSSVELYSDNTTNAVSRDNAGANLGTYPASNSLAGVNLVKTIVDGVVVFDSLSPVGPGLNPNPFSTGGGYYVESATSTFNRGSDNGFTGGLNVTGSAFLFDGSPASVTRAAATFGTGQGLGGNAAGRNSQVRGFATLANLSPVINGSTVNTVAQDYNAINNFNAFGFATNGAFVSYGFGQLQVPTSTTITLGVTIDPQTVSDPILLATNPLAP